MYDEPVPVDLRPSPASGDPAPDMRPDTREFAPSEQDCRVIELRMQLDLAQLDHPSRWAKLSR